MAGIVKGLSTLGYDFVSTGADTRLGLGTLIQTAKGCAVKAAIGATFAVAVGANPAGCAVAAVGYVLAKRTILQIDSMITQVGYRIKRSDVRKGNHRLRIVLSAVAVYGLKFLKTANLLTSPIACIALNRDLLQKLSDIVIPTPSGRDFSKTLFGNMVFSAIIPGTAAYVICSKVTAMAALKMGLSASLVASMPVSLAFGVTMAATTVIGAVLANRVMSTTKWCGSEWWAANRVLSFFANNC
jgi:hypothetical protein